MSEPVPEERHGFPGARRALWGVGGHVRAPHVDAPGAPMSEPVPEERHGFPGARRALGGVGGHVRAPHVDT